MRLSVILDCANQCENAMIKKATICALVMIIGNVDIMCYHKVHFVFPYMDPWLMSLRSTGMEPNKKEQRI